MKKIILTIITPLILGTGVSYAQEHTVYDGPSDLKEETENNGVYEKNEEDNYEINYIEKRDGLEAGLFENIIQAEEDKIKEEYQVPGYLNYKSWQFWFLIIILFSIIFVLIRLFKKLSKINAEIKKHENYLKETKVKKRPQVSEEDEIFYSEPSDE